MRRNRNGEPSAGRAGPDRAVSDVLAFILVFATIIGSVMLLSMTGFQAMTDYSDGEQLRNSERAMEALTENFNDVLRYDGIDKRRGELSLREGTFAAGSDGTVLEIELDTGAGTASADASPVTLGEFAYTTGSDRIIYEGGGVVRSAENGGSVVLKRPQLACDEGNESVLITIPSVQATNGSIQSSGTLEVTMNETERKTQIESGVDEVTVTANTDYDNAWNATLERSGWERDTASPTPKATCGESTGSDLQVVITVVETHVKY
ncbi:hypothetical protein [Natrinema pallidum]|uniref:Type IV pilin n=1 Tax=Natrinema pallidum TaxID=69527 RepID=A0A4P9TGP7_9EURY|nr:hypothetical protein [Natrinema pallidum]QCW03897.1 hypothetical protein FGF80_11895 [Natrinema pallidum]